MKRLLLIFILLLPINVSAHTEAPVDILDMNIIELQEMIDKKIINYETITRIYLERINEYNSTFNAIRVINPKAIDEAIALDLEFQLNGRSSLLFGIPIIVKDNIDVQGMPTTAGAKSLLDNYPFNNASIIQNLIDNKAIILAKSNMSEFAFSAANSRSSFGVVKNAYNTAYSSYGSSGGTAVAIALQFAQLGIGTDTNSSIRVPASGASLVGLRPTFNLLSNEGIIPYDITRDTAGPMTIKTLDNAIMLDVLAGNDGTLYLEDLNKPLSELKVGVLTQALNGDSKISSKATSGTTSLIKNLFNKKIEELKNLGIEVININNFYSAKIESYHRQTLSGWTFCYGFNEYIKNTSGTIKNFNQLARTSGHIQNLNGYVNSCSRSIKTLDKKEKLRERYRKYVNDTMEKYDVDVLLYPTTKNKINALNSSGANSTSYSISPITGFPAMNIPIGFDKDRLPYGMEMLTSINNEKLLYNIAYNIEKNNYEYQQSPLAKDLFIIPQSVTNLVNKYLENTDVITPTYKEEVLNFFKHYNEFENKEETAKLLLNRYEEIKNAPEFVQKIDEDPYTIYIDYANNLVSITLAILICLYLSLNINNRN